MDPLAVLAYGAEQAAPLIGMEWRWQGRVERAGGKGGEEGEMEWKR